MYAPRGSEGTLLYSPFSPFFTSSARFTAREHALPAGQDITVTSTSTITVLGTSEFIITVFPKSRFPSETRLELLVVRFGFMGREFGLPGSRVPD